MAAAITGQTFYAELRELLGEKTTSGEALAFAVSMPSFYSRAFFVDAPRSEYRLMMHHELADALPHLTRFL
jgi:hypothetical protein